MSEFDFGAEYASFGEELKGVAYEGDYDMLVVKMKGGTSGKGKQMFTVELAFTSGPLKAKGKTVTDKLYWSPENETAARIFAQSLRVLGASQEWIMADRPTPDQIAERCIGNVVAVNLKPDEFNGQPQTRVNYRKTVTQSGGPTVTKASAQAAAVSLDDDEAATEAPAAAKAEKEPVSVGAAASGSEDPWAEG